MTDLSNLKRIIQIARRELNLDEPTYKLLLLNTVGIESTREMDRKQLTGVLDAFKRLGFVIKPSKKKSSTESTDRQLQKIRSLWLEMHEQGIVRDSSDIALNTFIYKNTEIGRIEWLGSAAASKIIEKLKQWQKRPVKA